MFEPLRDPKYFVRVELVDGAPTWPNGPNGLDMAPDALYEDVRAGATDVVATG